MTPASIPMRVIQGATPNKVLRLMQPGRIYKEISAIAAAASRSVAPAEILTSERKRSC